METFLQDVQTVAVDTSAGPRGIVTAWRVRQRRLTSVTEQLKRRDVRSVVTLLSAASKGPVEKVPPSLLPDLRRWKELDSVVTEAFNEVRLRGRRRGCECAGDPPPAPPSLTAGEGQC